MKKKHIDRFIKQCLLLATNSPCPRAQYGAIVVEPVSRRNLSEGWNGPPRGEFSLCGNTTCTRNDEKIPSGQRTEVGCHHAEANALMNACAQGVATKGSWMFVNGAPCLNCAKLIHHSDVACCVIISDKRPSDGLEYLDRHGVQVIVS